MDAPVAQARTIRCPRCNGAVAVDALRLDALCPYCGTQLEIPEELRARLRLYQGALADAGVKVEAERDAADRARRAHLLLSPLGWAVAVGLLVGPPLLGIGVLFVLVGAQRLTPGQFETLSAVVGAAGGILGVGLFLAWILSRRRRDRPGLATSSSAVVCPSCGGLGTLSAGQLTGTCRYCGAALLPSGAVMQHAVADAEAQVYRARLERYREERRTLVAAADNVGRQTDILKGVRRALYVSPLAAAGFTAYVAGQEPNLWPAVVAAWCAVVAAGCVGLLVLLVRRDRARRVDAAFASLARQFNGASLPLGRAGQVGWLDALWAGPWPMEDLGTGPRHRSVALRVDGFNVLLELQPDVPLQFPFTVLKPRLLLVLAGALPGAGTEGEGRLPPSPDLDRSRQWLLDAGFALEVRPCGLVARAAKAQVKLVRRRPELLLGLAPVLARLAQLAAAARARPLEPIVG
jgi:hypothetical protein